MRHSVITDVARASRLPQARDGHPARARWILRCGSETLPHRFDFAHRLSKGSVRDARPTGFGPVLAPIPLT